MPEKYISGCSLAALPRGVSLLSIFSFNTCGKKQQKAQTAFHDCFRRYIFFSDLNINVKNTYYDIQFALHYLSMTDVTSSN